ncbi:hypothetical protein ACKAV7_008641 [Fusarium commune]
MHFSAVLLSPHACTTVLDQHSFARSACFTCHWLCRSDRPVDWPLIICVLTNPKFVATILNQEEKGKDQAWVKRALATSPNAVSLQDIKTSWDNGIPHVRDDELIHASEHHGTQRSGGPSSSATSATSSFSATILVAPAVVDGGLRPRSSKRRKKHNTPRNRTSDAASRAAV